MRRSAAVALAASAALAVLAFWAYIRVSASLASLAGERLAWAVNTAGVRFERLYGVPVLVNTGLMTGVAVSLTAALLPLALYASKRFREMEEYEEQLVTLLLSLPGMLAASGSAADALSRAARVLRPPLSTLVERAARLYRMTGDLDRALVGSLGNDELPPRVRVAARSIVVAARSGGRIHEILAKLASFMEASRRLTRLAEARLAEYKMIALLSVLAYAATAGATVALVSKASNVSLPGMAVRIDVDLIRGLFFYSLLTITLGSSLVIARVIHGYTPLAAKYLLALIPLGYLAFIASQMLV